MIGIRFIALFYLRTFLERTDLTKYLTGQGAPKRQFSPLEDHDLLSFGLHRTAKVYADSFPRERSKGSFHSQYLEKGIKGMHALKTNMMAGAMLDSIGGIPMGPSIWGRIFITVFLRE